MKTKVSVITGIVFFFIVIVFAAITSCKNDFTRNKTHPEIASSSIRKGRQLANIYCQSCHALPDPALLDTKTWEKGVLPAMGPRLGIFYHEKISYPSSRYDFSLDRNFYPSQPVLKPQEWQNIIDYYIGTSPDSLNIDDNKPIEPSLNTFEAKVPVYTQGQPVTSLVQFNPGQEGGLFVSDALTKKLLKFDAGLKVIDSFNAGGPIVSLEQMEQDLLLCDIGMLDPNNGKYGRARKTSFNVKGKINESSAVLFEGLSRPVQISATDLNGDKRTDYLVCEFGFLTGSLSWMENKGDEKFERHVLRPLPGAMNAYIKDYNKDGLPDIYVLFAQGEEGIFLFTNKGNGKFDQKQILRFPPVYGSSYFEFADYNKDGHDDIVYTCGDNADYSNVFKPYHGVYIFMNDGKDNFKQKFFFHINGCFKAIPRDYDNDGDIDIAAISFFADYARRPEEGFVYLKNNGGLNFTAKTTPEAKRGRWLTMNAGDLNGDGLIDLVLGNFTIGPALVKSAIDWKKGPPFLVLLNTGRK